MTRPLALSHMLLQIYASWSVPWARNKGRLVRSPLFFFCSYCCCCYLSTAARSGLMQRHNDPRFTEQLVDISVLGRLFCLPSPRHIFFFFLPLCPPFFVAACLRLSQDVIG
ncbi:hypothetical protein L209DRAFT_550845 [Thermothelomyces heterothallicus CBS 203.75]